jgi:hypothetical protein
VKQSIPTVIIEPRTLLREGFASLLHDSNFTVIASVATVDEMPQRAPGCPGLLIIGPARGTPDELQVVAPSAGCGKNTAGQATWGLSCGAGWLPLCFALASV